MTNSKITYYYENISVLAVVFTFYSKAIPGLAGNENLESGAFLIKFLLVRYTTNTNTPYFQYWSIGVIVFHH